MTQISATLRDGSLRLVRNTIRRPSALQAGCVLLIGPSLGFVSDLRFCAAV